MTYQPPEPQDLLAAAVAHLGIETRRDDEGPAGPLAKRLGLSYQRVWRWFQDGNGPDYSGTMTILQACGWLNMDADVPVREDTDPGRLELAADLVENQNAMLRLTQLVARRSGLSEDEIRHALDGDAQSPKRGGRFRR